MLYPNVHIAGRRIGRGGPMNWPPDISPLDFHAWGYLGKEKMYKSKVGTKDELLQRIFDAARHVNDATVRKVTLALVEQVRMRSQADSGHFEHSLN
jgi:hypothetical protein